MRSMMATPLRRGGGAMIMLLALTAGAAGQMEMNASICTSTVAINQLPAGTTTCLNLAPYCRHHLHGEYIQERCSDACAFCAEVNDPTQLNLAVGGDGDGATDADESSAESEALHTAAVGLAVAIGIMLVISLIYAAHTASKNADQAKAVGPPGKYAHDDAGDFDGMWDDETWDIEVNEAASALIHQRSSDTVEVDVARATEMLNRNGITPAIMREMLNMQNRCNLVKSMSPKNSPSQLSYSGSLRSRPIPVDRNLETRIRQQGRSLSLGADEDGARPISGYSFYTGPAAPQLSPSFQAYSTIDGDGDSPVTTNKAGHIVTGGAEIAAPASSAAPDALVQVELGELYTMVGVDDEPATTPMSSSGRRASQLAGLDFEQLMDRHEEMDAEVNEDREEPGSPRSSTGSEDSQWDASGGESALQSASSSLGDAVDEAAAAAATALATAAGGDRRSRLGVPDASDVSFQLEVPPSALDNRKDSAFSSDYGRESPDEKAKMQDEMNQKLVQAASQAIGQLAQMKEQSEAEINELSQQTFLSEQQIAVLTQGKNEADGKIAILEQQSAAQEAETKELRKHKAISQAELRKFKEIMSTLQLQNGNLNNTIRIARMQLGNLQSENAEVKKLLKSGSIELADAHNDVARLEMEKLNMAREFAQSFATVKGELNLLKDQHRTLSHLAKTEYPKVLFGLNVATSTLVGATETAIEDATADLLARYKYETRERKLLYNHIQELRGNIRVFCRVRFDERSSCVLRFPDKNALGTPTDLVCPNPKDAKLSKRFEFDRVFHPGDSQNAVFDDTEPVITSTVDGYNVSIIAYGQTGSGKTYTMMGTEDNPGVNRRAIRELLRVCGERSNIDYHITVSLLEIYNDTIIDLLTDEGVDKQNCQLRIDPATKAGFVQNLTWRDISAIEHVVQALQDGEKNRSTACTKMNSASSRSHLVLTLTVRGVDKVTEEETVGKLRMVDLAGCERIAKSGATGKQLTEANAINKSLSSLGQVFIGLRQGDKHIPFRNSKLTHLLQDSLGGQSKTCFFVNISPSESNLQETMSTLEFGSSIRKVVLRKPGAIDSPATKKKARRESEPLANDGFRDGAGVDFKPMPGSPSVSRSRGGSAPAVSGSRELRRATLDPAIERNKDGPLFE